MLPDAIRLTTSRSALQEGSINGATGGGQLGCLDNKNCHMTSVFCASPEETSRQLAFPNKPALAMEIAR